MAIELTPWSLTDVNISLFTFILLISWRWISYSTNGRPCEISRAFCSPLRSFLSLRTSAWTRHPRPECSRKEFYKKLDWFGNCMKNWYWPVMGAFGGGSTVEKMMSGTRPLPQAHLDNLQVYGRLDTKLVIRIGHQYELKFKWHKQSQKGYWSTK